MNLLATLLKKSLRKWKVNKKSENLQVCHQHQDQQRRQRQRRRVRQHPRPRRHHGRLRAGHVFRPKQGAYSGKIREL